MPHSEFITWRAYNTLEPFGCPVEDQRANFLLQLTHAIHRKDGAETPADWFNRWEIENEEEAPSPQALEAKIKGFFKGRQDAQSKPDTPINNQHNSGE
jgi:hypothetical protein